MKRGLLTQRKQSAPSGAGGSCSVGGSVGGWISNIIAGGRGQQPGCRAVGEGSQAGMPHFGMPAGASVNGSMLGGSVDASLMGHFGEFVKPSSALQERELDPTLMDKDVPEIRKDAGVILKSRPEIATVHGRLGAGNFGEVIHCTLKGSGQEVAVKVLHKGSELSQKREVELLGQLRHENLVQLICVLHGPPDAFVLELCAGGCLADVLHGPKAQEAGVANLGLRPRASVMLDVVSAVAYLHGQLVLHRDIKPGNVFLTTAVSTPMIDLPPAKLGDLGLARELDRHMTSNSYSESADVYSCGLLLWEVMSGKVPFDGFNVMRVVQAVTMGQRPDPKDITGPCPIIDVLGEVLGVSWAEEPTDRPSASYLGECIKPLAKGV